MKGNNSMKVCLDENVLLDSQKTDVIGNLYMEVGKKQGLTVMISAHSDEIGLQVVYIDKAGFVSLLSGEIFSGQ